MLTFYPCCADWWPSFFTRNSRYSYSAS